MMTEHDRSDEDVIIVWVAIGMMVLHTFLSSETCMWRVWNSVMKF